MNLPVIPTSWGDIDNQFRLDNTGRLMERIGTDAAICGIENIILTRPGERVMRPKFGCYAYQSLFEPLSTSTGRVLGAEILRAVNEEQSRGTIENINITVDYNNSAYILSISVVITATGQTVNVTKILVQE